jgi:hypothetical protein
MIPDIFLERMADYYTSEFVKKNMPWIREIPFHEFLERQYFQKYNHFSS